MNIAREKYLCPGWRGHTFRQVLVSRAVGTYIETRTGISCGRGHSSRQVLVSKAV